MPRRHADEVKTLLDPVSQALRPARSFLIAHLNPRESEATGPSWNISCIDRIRKRAILDDRNAPRKSQRMYYSISSPAGLI